MQIETWPEACFWVRALGTMGMAETEVNGAVRPRMKSPKKRKSSRLHADEPLGVLVEQLGEGRLPTCPDKMIQASW